MLGCPTDVCKFFGCELGAQTQMDIKNSRYIVNGAHEEARLQDLLDGFIKKFVLCPECENPETHLVRMCIVHNYCMLSIRAWCALIRIGCIFTQLSTRAWCALIGIGCFN